MHFGIIAPPLAGHYGPLAALARELVSRGHRATFVHHAGAQPLAARHGAAFVPLPTGSAGEHRRIGGTVREMARQMEMLCREAPPLFRDLGVDAILADQLEPAGGLIAEHLELPFASVACALPMNREAGVPPPFVGWRYDPSASGLRRNRGGWTVSDVLMRPLGRAIARRADAWGLEPRRRLEDCFSRRLQLAQAVPSIDFPRRALPPHFHYLGPFRHNETSDFRLPALNGRQFLYCTFGTLQGWRARLFARVAAACADLGLPLVLTHGGRLTQRQVARLPGEVHAFDYLPQEAVLDRAPLCITHGGFNTVLDCLARGKPLVALPLAFEQAAIAARIARSGAGETVPPMRASRKRLAAAIARVLEGGHAAAARRIGEDIAQAGGVVRAADLIEAGLG
ncbi:glycosyltransferase [Sphingomonas parva]|uniref:Glycosyltransferase n=1 Tax=Sphingomonas parva TaxID=2555898 RepID=A0A4Y8ZZP0_9SPHN|nr:nucleotide disphospho-sugar-binding domain-containing protein [Sphingomonas parva]TFI60336.1 glycosyltransferase [Sphingomonas parva]